MKDTREIILLRTMLRDVNVEHSALLRSKVPQGKVAKMAELKGQRLALMSRIAELRQRHGVEPLVTSHRWALQGSPGIGRALAATLQRYWPGLTWIDPESRQGKTA